MYRTSEISVHKILNYVRLAYLSRSAADEGLYFWCSVRRRWCCCGRPGCTSSLLIIVFCCRCPPPGQHSASSQHLPTHARAPHRVTIATGDEGPPYCLISQCSKNSEIKPYPVKVQSTDFCFCTSVAPELWFGKPYASISFFHRASKRFIVWSYSHVKMSIFSGEQDASFVSVEFSVKCL